MTKVNCNNTTCKINTDYVCQSISITLEEMDSGWPEDKFFKCSNEVY